MSDPFKSFTKIQPITIKLPYNDELFTLLINEYRILHLLYHRNSNQHRVAKWWSSLNIIHRHLRKILLLMEDIQEIKTFRRLSTIKWNSNKKSFFKSNEIPNLILKKKFIRKEGKKKIEKNIMLHDKLTYDESIKLINKKLNLFIKECKYLYHNTIPDSYWKFMGVIGLAQFVNIGFTLIGLISRLWNLLSKIDGIKVNLKFQKLLIDQNEKMKIETKKKTSNISESEKDTENDIGEVVDLSKVEEVEEVEEAEKAEKAIKKNSKPISVMDNIFGDMNTPKKKKKNSKKKSNNTIDDIFGF